MEATDRLADAQRADQERAQGKSLRGFGTLAYTPEMERGLSRIPTLPGFRTPLQNNDGTFKSRPKDDGTLETGSYGVDSYGRYVTAG